MGAVLVFFFGGGMRVRKSGMSRCEIFMFAFVFQSVKIVLAFFEKISKVLSALNTKWLE